MKNGNLLETLDVVIWIMSGAVAGIIAGLYLHAAPRQVMFLAILFAGVITLIRLYQLKRQPEHSHYLTSGEPVRLPASHEKPIQLAPPETTPPPKPLAPQVVLGDMQSLLTHEGALSGAESRAWLDAFLKKQQN